MDLSQMKVLRVFLPRLLHPHLEEKHCPGLCVSLYVMPNFTFILQLSTAPLWAGERANNGGESTTAKRFAKVWLEIAPVG